MSHVLTALAAHTDTATATAPVAAALKTGKPITGQYLFNRLVAAKDELSKIQIVESAVQVCDVAAFKHATDEMVAIAKEKCTAAEYKTAANHRSVLRKVYGALRFAPAELKKAGYTAGSTGYHAASKLALEVLKDKGIDWQGIKAKSPEQRAKERDARIENKVFKEAAEQTERIEGENLLAWNTRVMAKASTMMETAYADAQKERIIKLADAITKMAGKDIEQVVEELNNRLFPHSEVITE